MNVKTLVLFYLSLVDFAISKKEENIDTIKIYEKIDRVGNVQDGGAQDLEKVLTKGIMDEFENDKFFNS